MAKPAKHGFGSFEADIAERNQWREVAAFDGAEVRLKTLTADIGQFLQHKS